MNKLSGWTARLAALAIIAATNISAARAEEPAGVEATKVTQDPDVKPGDEPAALLAERNALIKISDKDTTLGDAKAPVTMIEYASMSCSHCSAFHKETFGRIKKDYIDTGKVYFALRDFPLNKAAVTGASLARCAPKEKYFSYVSALFSSQDEWVVPEIEQKLEGIARIGGMSKEKFSECIKDEKQINAILESRFAASKVLGIRSTPTFFIEGIQYEGGKDYDFFAGVLDKLIKEKGGTPPVHTPVEKAPGDEKKPEEAKDEKKPEEAKDEKKPEEAKDEKKPEEAKDEKKPEEAKDEKKPEEAKDEKKPEEAKDEKKPEEAKDEKKPEEAKDEKKPEEAKDEKKPEEAKDEKKPEEAKDEKKSEEAKDEKKPEEAKDEKKPEEAKDEKKSEEAKDEKKSEEAKDEKKSEEAKDEKKSEEAKDEKKPEEKK